MYPHKFGAEGCAIDLEQAQRANEQHQHQQDPVEIAKGNVAAQGCLRGTIAAAGAIVGLPGLFAAGGACSSGFVAGGVGRLSAGGSASGWAISTCDSVVSRSAGRIGLSVPPTPGAALTGLVLPSAETVNRPACILSGVLASPSCHTAATSACLGPEAAPPALATCVWRVRCFST